MFELRNKKVQAWLDNTSRHYVEVNSKFKEKLQNNQQTKII
jgi:hypothetical protein